MTSPIEFLHVNGNKIYSESEVEPQLQNWGKMQALMALKFEN